MHDAVKLGLDKTSSLELPAFELEELNYWLNEAQLQLVKQKMYGNNYRGEGFEDSGKRIDDLNPLVSESTQTALTSHPFYPNVKILNTININVENGGLEIPADYMFYISSSVEYSNSNPDYDPTRKIVETVPILQNNIKNFIQTEFNTPYIKTPYVYFYDNKIGYIHDPYKDIEYAYIKFIKRPGELIDSAPSSGQVTESELPEQVHPEIVSLTVNLLLENIESQRLQTHLMQLNKKE